MTRLFLNNGFCKIYVLFMYDLDDYFSALTPDSKFGRAIALEMLANSKFS